MHNIAALRPVVVLAVFTACKQSFPLSIFIASYLSQHCSVFISLQIKCEELKLDNLTILPSVPQLEVAEYQSVLRGFSSNIHYRQQTTIEPQAQKFQYCVQNWTGLLKKLWNRCKFHKKTKKCFLLNTTGATAKSLHGTAKTGHQRLEALLLPNPWGFVWQRAVAGSPFFPDTMTAEKLEKVEILH